MRSRTTTTPLSTLRDAAMTTTMATAPEPTARSVHKQHLDQLLTEREYHVEEWYEDIKQHTFRTICFEMSSEEITAVLGTKRNVSGENIFHSDGATARLADRIDVAMGELKSGADDDDGFVVRLSTRSGKDVILHRLSTARWYAKERESFHAEPLGNPAREAAASSAGGSCNTRRQYDDGDGVCFVRACGSAMRCTSGREAVTSFVDSERIREDLESAVRNKIMIKVIVRSFQRLKFELEFRAFVSRGRMVAISQYYTTWYFNEINRRKDELALRMVDFHREHIQPVLGVGARGGGGGSDQPAAASRQQAAARVPLTNYVIDFAFDCDDKLWVVEINMPPPIAGSCLFHPKESAVDMIILTGSGGGGDDGGGGDGGCVVRIVDEYDESKHSLRAAQPYFFERVKEERKKMRRGGGGGGGGVHRRRPSL
eukprot:TRINITY_DN325_c0_g11_i1.p1 TRINITY_DN325_c0_g11~~TRINITY_DN325_c0_g11_i1.p1  ORF type:complete len:428 (-),score=121.39 TRINITY_DN325_c0_g11_i1:141-1424(-)